MQQIDVNNTKPEIYCEHTEVWPLEKFIENPRNPNTHPKGQLEALVKVIKGNGWRLPIVVSKRSGFIVKGHGRYQAARMAGWTEAPVDLQDYESEAKEWADMIADNKIAELAINDEDKLAKLIQELNGKVELATLGMKDAELNRLITQTIEEVKGEDDVSEKPKDAKTKRGDLYEIDNHRLLCGDSTDIADVTRLMNNQKADMIWTDPPYNVAIEGQAGKIMNDDMTDSAFKAFLAKVYKSAYESLKEGGVIYVAHADTERVNFTKLFEESGLKLSQILIWVKQSAPLSRQDFNWQHEPIIYGWKEGASHYFCQDFTRTTVIDDDVDYKQLNKQQLLEVVNNFRTAEGTTVLRQNRPTTSELHPTMKPVSLISRMISWSSRQGESVLDLFGGSGSTMVSAQKIGRRAHLMELDPAYCDVIVTRMKKLYPAIEIKLNGNPINW